MNRRGLAVSAFFSLLLMLAVTSCIPTSFSVSSPYSVQVQLSNRTINPLLDSRITVNFTISGLGDFLNGSVKVDSDAVNLLADTYALQGFYLGTDGRIYQWLDEYPRVNYGKKVDSTQFDFRGINCEWIDYDVCSHYSQYSSTITMQGKIVLDPSTMKPGSYEIKVTFTAHNIIGDFKAYDSVTYQLLEFRQANYYFWAVSILTGAIAATMVGAHYLEACEKKNNQERKRENENSYLFATHRI